MFDHWLKYDTLTCKTRVVSYPVKPLKGKKKKIYQTEKQFGKYFSHVIWQRQRQAEAEVERIPVKILYNDNITLRSHNTNITATTVFQKECPNQGNYWKTCQPVSGRRQKNNVR